MNRRIFLKLLGLSPIAPSVLMTKEKPVLREAKKFIDNQSDNAKWITPTEWPKPDEAKVERFCKDMAEGLLPYLT